MDSPKRASVSPRSNAGGRCLADFDGFTVCADPRGFSTWLKHQASKFLQPSDPRLLLNTIVTNVSYSDTGEHITTSNGSCVEADYAISTIDSVYVEDGEFRVCGSTCEFYY